MPATTSPARTPPRSLPKGTQTRAAILEAALALATRDGLEGLSIGALAKATGMSKSGVFAHFGSREDLQIATILEYHTRFETEVFTPALRQPRGLPRLRDMVARWMRRSAVEIDSGCLYISGAVEFDDRPGAVREALADSVNLWHAALRRAIAMAREAGHLHADASEEQMLFEMHGLILALHYEARFLKASGSLARARVGFEDMLRRHGARADGPGRAAATSAVGRAHRPARRALSKSPSISTRHLKEV